ncbi:hypothetical protein Vadar_033544 [Vaccinium darrowii]|uniref:Uncharacterized protein n=1 Tax=Vaccinium darrowii TaxID=229202 RepID=A0ACB7X692_9ERIC|nr:hypothetical protein Vadar_033544 [Vaccinium darrowii]
MPPSSTHLSLILFFFFFFNSISPSHSTPFSPSPNITFFGDAHFTKTSISLTPQHTCLPPPSSSLAGFGRAFFFNPVRFLDSKTNSTASFSTQFSFTITNPYAPFCPFGDGFTFVIASKPDSFSYGSMGLPNGQDFSYVAVEFDTMLDPNFGDVNDNHIGIDVDSVVSVASVDGFSKGIDLKSEREMTAWIEYRDKEETIKVWVGYSQIKPPSPLLIAQINLSKHFKEFMHVGFSASNGRGSAVHLVGGWKFKTYGLLPLVMPMETVAGEGDCFMCSSPGELGGQNSNSNYHHIDKRVGELALGLGGLAAFIISLSAIVVIVIWCMTRKKRLYSRGSNEGQIQRFQGNKLPRRLPLAAIKSATKGFNHNRIIGEGGSATVYEGRLPSCGPVAVKRFSQVSQMAPEYVYLGVPSVKTDVYSFGVVVLEVASGKKPVNEEGTLLADYMWELWGKGKLMEAADLKLRGKFNKLGMERMLMVGLCCVHPDYEKRPMVREAARMIRGEAPLPVLPARKPAVSIRSVFPGGSGEFTNSVGDESLNCDDTPWLTPKTHF